MVANAAGEHYGDMFVLGFRVSVSLGISVPLCTMVRLNLSQRV